MIAYILRRLLLMIPTLIGITFLVFMLIALSPGGIGAAIRQSSGLEIATSRALQEAYLEDRYGLSDPVLVQYLRWLGRISPIKFGVPDLLDPTGEFVRPPRDMAPPPLAGEWYALGVMIPPPAPASAGVLTGGTPVAGRSAAEEYRRGANAYARQRAAFVASRVTLEQALREYASKKGLRGAVGWDQSLALAVFRREGYDPSDPDYAPVARAGIEAMYALERARVAQRSLDSALRAGPYPEAVWSLPVPFTNARIPLRLGPISLGPPDFGRSFSKGVPVTSLIADAMPVTLLLNMLAIPIIYLIAIPAGILAATRRGSWFDIGSGALFVALWSIPVVWAGVLAVGYLARRDQLGWFPTSGLHDPDSAAFPFLPIVSADGSFRRGYLLDTLWHICLPVACLVYTGFAVLSKQTRAAMLDNFSADFVRTARAKGVSGRDIVLRHVLRNSLLPLITLLATLTPAMLSGSVVVERIFTVPGMGSLIIDSINLRDRELLLANTLMIAGVNLVALLVADILYATADPRIAYE